MLKCHRCGGERALLLEQCESDAMPELDIACDLHRHEAAIWRRGSWKEGGRRVRDNAAMKSGGYSINRMEAVKGSLSVYIGAVRASMSIRLATNKSGEGRRRQQILDLKGHSNADSIQKGRTVAMAPLFSFKCPADAEHACFRLSPVFLPGNRRRCCAVASD